MHIDLASMRDVSKEIKQLLKKDTCLLSQGVHSNDFDRKEARSIFRFEIWSPLSPWVIISLSNFLLGGRLNDLVFQGAKDFDQITSWVPPLKFLNLVNINGQKSSCTLNRLVYFTRAVFPIDTLWSFPLSIAHYGSHWTALGRNLKSPRLRPCSIFYFYSFFLMKTLASSHCSILKWIRYECDRHSPCSSKTVLLIPFSK